MQHPCPSSLPTRFTARITSCTKLPKPFLWAPQALHPALLTLAVGGNLLEQGLLCQWTKLALWDRVSPRQDTPKLGFNTGTAGWIVPRGVQCSPSPGQNKLQQRLNPGTSAGNLCSSKHAHEPSTSVFSFYLFQALSECL